MTIRGSIKALIRKMRGRAGKTTRIRNRHHEVVIGSQWIEKWEKDDPFVTCYYEITDIKEGYVQYKTVYSWGDGGDRYSMSINSLLRSFCQR